MNNGHGKIIRDQKDVSITSLDDAQSTLAVLEGDLNDLNSALEEEEWSDAREQVEEIEGRIQAIKEFIAQKADN